jgi:hypothetical protein
VASSSVGLMDAPGQLHDQHGLTYGKQTAVISPLTLITLAVHAADFSWFLGDWLASVLMALLAAWVLLVAQVINNAAAMAGAKRVKFAGIHRPLVIG